MGYMHPQVVHFAVALLFVGVGLRALSLVARERFPFVGSSAALLLVLGTLAAIAAAFTGDAAHPPVEAMPGLRPIVSEHEEWGEWARNVFFVVMLVELVALAMRKSARAQYALILSTVIGLVGLFVLYEAAEHGGEIVYGYGGGVGIRSGKPEDVKRLFLAGLYQQALQERKNGHKTQAYELMDQAARSFPDDVDVTLARIESLLIDRNDPQGAIQGLAMIHPPKDNRFQRTRHAFLQADALAATGQKDGAIAVLQQLNTDMPSPRVTAKIEQLRR